MNDPHDELPPAIVHATTTLLGAYLAFRRGDDESAVLEAELVSCSKHDLAVASLCLIDVFAKALAVPDDAEHVLAELSRDFKMREAAATC